MTTIKAQAKEALERDPFATTFVCETKCSRAGCGCFTRQISGRFKCTKCSSRYAKKYRETKKDKIKKYFAAWYQENREYCLNKERAKYQLKKEKGRNSATI